MGGPVRYAPTTQIDSSETRHEGTEGSAKQHLGHRVGNNTLQTAFIQQRWLILATAFSSALITVVTLSILQPWIRAPDGDVQDEGGAVMSVKSCREAGVVFHGLPNNVPIPNGPHGSCWCGAADQYCLCTPSLSVDIGVLRCPSRQSINDDISLVFVTRKFDPVGLAIPGGYVNVGESVEDAALRELEEETGLQLTHPLHDVEQIHVFSRPNRDHRRAGAAVLVTGMDGLRRRAFCILILVRGCISIFSDQALMLMAQERNITTTW
eukprot:m.717396 g.717396  ORF g.717396 m.717396 type:complete len:266 (+) comp22986_c0_seq26:404-1201(+)